MTNTPALEHGTATLRQRTTAMWPLVLKIVLLATFSAAMVFLISTLLTQGNTFAAVLAAIGTVVVNWIYLSKRALPAKYITPGLIFLLIFQVFVIIYTFYIAFTNYSTGHILSKDEAVQSLLSQNQERVPDSPALPITVVSDGGDLGFLVTLPNNTAVVGTESNPLEQVDAVFDGGKAISAEGYTSLSFADVLQRQSEIFALSIPFSEDAADGSIRTLDGNSGYQYLSTITYDEISDTLVNNSNGVIYHDRGNGQFETDEGAVIYPGWNINVGWDNFSKALSEDSIRGPLIYVTLWTFAFALITVFATFALGLLMAIVFNDNRMRGRKIYRIVMILPYAFPAFLGAMVWSGMYSESFGFINQVLLGGSSIPWLTDPFLAKVALLIVNLWLGFPYMFLVTLGALQSIPPDVDEAAKTDGANSWQIFRRIKLPLLLVSIAPILISTFAFNFNNFNVIYMVTGGGPRDTEASIPVGHTDILISMVYKVAFTGQQRDYGLASAFSILIFIIVATISIISFRKTKVLEEIN